MRPNHESRNCWSPVREGCFYNVCTKHGNRYKIDIQITLTDSARMVTSSGDFDRTLRAPRPAEGFVDGLCRLTSSLESTDEYHNSKNKKAKKLGKKKNNSKHAHKNKKNKSNLAANHINKNPKSALEEGDVSNRGTVPNEENDRNVYHYSNASASRAESTFIPQTLDATWSSQQSGTTYVPQTLDGTWNTQKGINESTINVPQTLDETWKSQDQNCLSKYIKKGHRAKAVC
ncbi:unnamed protein product [Oikopleura dioica]|uniref:Uncharacterized protein n=2 Tax=Oikopleura dioica TaxID=34765 RepID=E4YJD5_OIKDI|nr:unnamed protein product [Oikopleura dioica]